MIVAKFGGTSVASKQRILNIVEITKKQLSKKPVLVVSAVSKVTDALLKKDIKLVKKIHQELIKDLFTDSKALLDVSGYIDVCLKEAEKLAKLAHLIPKDWDHLVSFGEIISSYIIAKFLQANGVNSQQILATELIVTDDNYQNAEVLPRETAKQVKEILLPLISQNIVPVVTGFIAATKSGQTTTLGRGGSDYSASIIGQIIEAEEIQIWTDVDGIMTSDPKIVKNAKIIELISYQEASELAVLGAKVLHPKTILPAIKKNIPVKILNTFKPNYKGTTILSKVSKKNYVTAIACKKDIQVIDIYTPQMFHVYGFLYKIFKIFSEEKISVDFISTSETSISLTIDGRYNTEELVKRLSKMAEVQVKQNYASVSVVGKPLKSVPVIPAAVYAVFEDKKIDIEMISAGASKVNETIVVRQKDADQVVKIMHERLILNQ